MNKKIGGRTLKLAEPVSIVASASVAGKKEGEGPLAGCFDALCRDNRLGQPTWEAAERALLVRTARLCLHRGCCYLAVYAAFSQRGAAAAAAGGVALGASPVHYAYREEHGLPLGKAALVELARALGAAPPG